MKIRALAAFCCLTFAVGLNATSEARANDGSGLSVHGLNAEKYAQGSVELDMAALTAMPVTEFETSTIWTDGVHRFSGVAISDLLSLLGAEGSVIRARAANDYAVEIPISDAVPSGPIIAYLLDGEPMSIRDKGPFWLVYPYDSDHSYRSEIVYSRSIWQLESLTMDE